MNKKKPSPKVDSLSDGQSAALSARAVSNSEEMNALDDLIKMVGETPPITRFSTGLPWMDWAIGGGFPRRIMAEAYGPPKSFKSTTFEYLAGRAAAGNGNIALLEFEQMERRQVQLNLLPSGFRGEVYNMPSTVDDKGEVVPMSDEERLRMFLTILASDGYAAGIVDPLGAFVPTAEAEEDSMDESHMGLWAKQAAKFSRAAVYKMRTCERPVSIFVVNHEYTMLNAHGKRESKGHTWKHGCGLRLKFSRWYKSGEASKSGELKDGSWIVGCEVVANKFGPDGREFSFVVKAGRGVHPGLSAVHACMMLGLAEVGKTGHVSIGGKGCGTFNQMVSDKWRDAELFAPFTAALEAWRDERLAEDAK